MTDYLLPMAMALLLGSVIGVERQWHRRLIDLKTNALVSLGACLFMLITKSPNGFQDPIRMAGQIVVGVGFIGGGLLFRDAGQMRGVNTAATLWCSAAVGAMCGIDHWEQASAASLIIVAANLLLRHLAQFLNLNMGLNDSLSEKIQWEFVASHSDASSTMSQVLAVFHQKKWEVRDVKLIREVDGSSHINLTVVVEQGLFNNMLDEILLQLNAIDLRSLSWQIV